MQKQMLNIVLLTNTKNEYFYNMTINCINSLYNSCKHADIFLNLIIVETQNREFILKKLFEYNSYDILNNYITTVFNNEKLDFNYNQFLNKGFYSLFHVRDFLSIRFISKGNKIDNFYGVINNDILLDFDSIKNLYEIKNSFKEYSSFSIIDKNNIIHKEILVNNQNKKILEGYKTAYEICGWNLFFNQNVLNHVLPFDERFSFWYQDNDYANNLIKNKLKHGLILEGNIRHLENQSHELIEKENYYNVASGLQNVFINKWNKNNE